MLTALLIGLFLLAVMVVLLRLLFPRATVTVHCAPADAPRFYACGCRRVGAVGSPGCDDCTEPGLR